MFLNFNTADNASANLDAGISASTTTVTVGLGEGAVFPATNSILTLVQYNTPADPTSGVLKFEKILMTSRSGDILTVTRGYDGTTGTTFDSGDYIYLNVTSKVIEDIQDEVVRLESDKLNLGSLRTGLATAWRMLFTNGSNNETELAFGASGRVLTSSGASSAPTWAVPTVDIDSLAPETTLANDDAIVFFDESAGGNKKITRQYMQDSFTTPSYGVASSVVQGASDSVVSSTSSGSYANVKNINVYTTLSGTVRVSFELRQTLAGQTAYGYIAKNGTSVAGPVSTSLSSFQSYTYDLVYNPGDVFGLYILTSNNQNPVEARNFRVSFDIARIGYANVV